MTVARANPVWIFASFAIAILSGFLQYRYLTEGPTSFILVASALLAGVIWMLSVGLCFVKAGKTGGFLSLVGIVPAMAGVWLTLLLYSACAFTGSCI